MNQSGRIPNGVFYGRVSRFEGFKSPKGRRGIERRFTVVVLQILPDFIVGQMIQHRPICYKLQGRERLFRHG